MANTWVKSNSQRYKTSDSTNLQIIPNMQLSLMVTDKSAYTNCHI